LEKSDDKPITINFAIIR